jgi:hypothetical protein
MTLRVWKSAHDFQGHQRAVRATRKRPNPSGRTAVRPSGQHGHTTTLTVTMHFDRYCPFRALTAGAAARGLERPPQIARATRRSRCTPVGRSAKQERDGRTTGTCGAEWGWLVSSGPARRHRMYPPAAHRRLVQTHTEKEISLIQTDEEQVSPRAMPIGKRRTWCPLSPATPGLAL